MFVASMLYPFFVAVRKVGDVYCAYDVYNVCQMEELCDETGFVEVYIVKYRSDAGAVLRCKISEINHTHDL